MLNRISNPSELADPSSRSQNRKENDSQPIKSNYIKQHSMELQQ